MKQKPGALEAFEGMPAVEQQKREHRGHNLGDDGNEGWADLEAG